MVRYCAVRQRRSMNGKMPEQSLRDTVGALTVEDLRRVVYFGIMRVSGDPDETSPQTVIDAWFESSPPILSDFIADVKSALRNWKISPESGRRCALSSAITPRPVKKLLEQIPELKNLYFGGLATDDETLHGFLTLLTQLLKKQDG